MQAVRDCAPCKTIGAPSSLKPDALNCGNGVLLYLR